MSCCVHRYIWFILHPFISKMSFLFLIDLVPDLPLKVQQKTPHVDQFLERFQKVLFWERSQKMTMVIFFSHIINIW